MCLNISSGWYLSMKFEDSFFNKLGGEERPFGTFNARTLGVMLVSLSSVAKCGNVVTAGKLHLVVCCLG